MSIYIGTSGWIYGDWWGRFYPKKIKPRDALRYYSRHFKTAEINYSFYHLPSRSAYRNWFDQTPDDFVFSVKASRYITHVKRLKGVGAAWSKFLKNASSLGKKLGPILLQFPPNFHFNPENKKHLVKFLRHPRKSVKNIRANRFKIGGNPRLALEFRHESWLNPEVYRLLRKHKAAWVISDSPGLPRADAVTAGFVYIRMHEGRRDACYTENQLEKLSGLIKKFRRARLRSDKFGRAGRARKKLYVYFNNDSRACAVSNAKTLMKLLMN